jgi:hypothetical protein
MFNDKPYLSVNREERFFCVLFAHALLASSSSRKRICDILFRRLDVELDPDALEVFLEVAALRDYWNDLGDPKRYSPETHRRRREILDAIMRMESLEPGIIDVTPLFWTAQPGSSKLWSPGRWNLSQLEAANLHQLKPMRWAFNAKPDILLLSPTGGTVIEAKLESGEGQDEPAGYEQMPIQRLVVRLWKAFIPGFSQVRDEPATLKLSRENADGLTWKDVIALADEPGVDEFTRRGLRYLERYSRQEAA